jgi:hypothetical protein
VTLREMRELYDAAEAAWRLGGAVAGVRLFAAYLIERKEDPDIESMRWLVNMMIRELSKAIIDPCVRQEYRVPAPKIRKLA